MADRPEKRVLIFRRGSIGDTVVSLPALHVIAETFSRAERRILTNRPVMDAAAPLQSIVDGTGLADGFFLIASDLRRPAEIVRLHREIRAWRPEVLIYLSEPSTPLRLFFEISFFLSCGLFRFIGLPIGPGLRRYRQKTDQLWESESERLLRGLSSLDTGRDTGKRDWSLAFPQKDREEAKQRLGDWSGASKFIAFSVGAKLSDKDWGDANWRSVLSGIAADRDDIGLAAFGAAEDSARTQALLDNWPGPSLNLCGAISPRVSAIMMGDAIFYLGHDTGPMHLAALAGTKCVAVFSARAKPGVWFPHGDGHAIFYPWDFAKHVPAKPGFRNAGNSIQAIDPKEVTTACLSLLDQHRADISAPDSHA